MTHIHMYAEVNTTNLLTYAQIRTATRTHQRSLTRRMHVRKKVAHTNSSMYAPTCTPTYMIHPREPHSFLLWDVRGINGS